VEVCANCGAENSLGSRFCNSCGTLLSTDVPPREVRKRVTIVFSDLKGSTSLGEFHRRQYGWKGSPIHDAVAVAHVLRPDFLETIERGVTVDTGPELSRGRTYVDVWRRTDWRPNAHVAVDIRAENFLDLLIERLNALA
jgi:inosine-uridine nucleoside N-ribohydrolase